MKKTSILLKSNVRTEFEVDENGYIVPNSNMINLDSKEGLVHFSGNTSYYRNNLKTMLSHNYDMGKYDHSFENILNAFGINKNAKETKLERIVQLSILDHIKKNDSYELPHILEVTKSFENKNYKTIDYYRNNYNNGRSRSFINEFVLGTVKHTKKYTVYTRLATDGQSATYYYINGKEEMRKVFEYLIIMNARPSFIPLALYNYLDEYDAKTSYNHIRIPKKTMETVTLPSGETVTRHKMRDIYDPEDTLKIISKKLGKNLSNTFDKSKDKIYNYAYVSRRSVRDNARAHRNNEKLIHFDFEKMFDNFYPEDFSSIVEHRLISRGSTRSIENRFNDIEDIKKTLDTDVFETDQEMKKIIINNFNELTFIKRNGKYRGVYTGNPYIPIMTNMVTNKVAKLVNSRIKKELKTKGEQSMVNYLGSASSVVVTFYADDINISYNPLGEGSDARKVQDEVFSIKNLTRIINAALLNFKLRLRINFDKTRRFSNPDSRITTGVRITTDQETKENIIVSSRPLYSDFRNILYRLDKAVSKDEIQGVSDYINEKYGNVSHLLGKVSFAHYIEDEGQKFDRLFSKYEDLTKNSMSKFIALLN